MKGRSRSDSLDAQPRKRPRHLRHALALGVVALTGAGMLLVTDDDGGSDATASVAASSTRTENLAIPGHAAGQTRPDDHVTTSALSGRDAPKRIAPPETPPPAHSGRKPDTKRMNALASLSADPLPPIKHLLTSQSRPMDGDQPSLRPWQQFAVKSGDSLATVFHRAGLTPRDVYTVVNADEQAKALTQLHPGDTIGLRTDANGDLQAVRYDLSETRTLVLRRRKGDFQPSIKNDPLTTRQATATGTIDSSLYATAIGAGLSDRQVMQLAHIFGWDIDFALDLRKGDSFRVVYETLYRDDEKVRNGDILAAEFVNSGETFRAVRFTFPNGDRRYFTPDGKSMRKAFLRTPVNFTRVSSEFNPDRLHPVLGYKRPHMGTDYAAPSGTPIKAAGDGKIIHIGRKGGYGNAIVIQHGSRYSTLYGHMRGFRKGLSKGDRVKQGEVIGYVGMSGLATGPHLHYEFRIDGKHRNPRTVKLPEADPIPAKYRTAFKEQTSPLMVALDGVATPTQLARSSDNQ